MSFSNYVNGAARILIAIPCRNRRAIARECLPTVFQSKAPQDVVRCYNDGSFMYDAEWLRKLGADWALDCISLGIEGQRRLHFTDFDAVKDEFTHLYLTDLDAPHDPSWRAHALHLQELSGGLPCCLYNTDAHVRLEGNTIEDDPAKPYLLRRVAPGISYLLTRKHVERIMPHVDTLQHWDWQVPGLLGYRMCVARQSHISHVGHGGLHHPKDGEGDVPLNPTEWLVEKRKEIVEALKK